MMMVMHGISGGPGCVGDGFHDDDGNMVTNVVVVMAAMMLMVMVMISVVVMVAGDGAVGPSGCAGDGFLDDNIDRGNGDRDGAGSGVGGHDVDHGHDGNCNGDGGSCRWPIVTVIGQYTIHIHFGRVPILHFVCKHFDTMS